MADGIFDNSEVTVNSKQIAILKKNFPQCFDKQGAFVPEKLQAIVSDGGAGFSKESYGLNWLGKSYARLLANENPRTLLSEDKDHNSKPENMNSENLLIKGDNLEVLKHLVHAYSEKVKMIYIDPPYNTGSDGFVYQDDRKFTPVELSQLAGIDEGEAKRILDFTESKANSHSAWLTFMYPRLYVARELLKDDGVIFISIDDNEVAQLKMLCDEVFGEQNFVAKFIWEKRTNRENRKAVSVRHDYILCYQHSNGSNERVLSQLPMSEKALSSYKNPDSDPRGEWKSDPAHAQAGHGTKSQFYTLVSPNGKQHELESGRCWVYTEPVMNKMIQDGRIWFGRDGNGVPRIKTYLNGKVRGLTPESIWFAEDVTTNELAKNQIKELFEGVAVFETPKPVALLNRIAMMSMGNNGVVLDFFAGSGSTAHAVMQLNADDCGSRRCISVQIDEATDKNSEAYKEGYKTIFEITKARIEKAATKIKEENQEYQGDLGFKIFETKPIPEAYLKDIEQLEQGQSSMSFIQSEDVDDLLTTWQVYDGIPLTARLNTVDLEGYTAHQYAKTLYLMDKGFHHGGLTAILKLLDGAGDEGDIERLVVFAHHFDSKNQREISEALKQYQNKKEKAVSVEFRY